MSGSCRTVPDMANDTRLELRLPADLLNQIDAARGDVPRAAFVRRILEDRVSPPTAAPEPVSEEAPVAASGERIPSRPTPPRGQPSKRPDTSLRTAHTLPKVERKAKATDALSTALKRQQALNKGKGI